MRRKKQTTLDQEEHCNQRPTNNQPNSNWVVLVWLRSIDPIPNRRTGFARKTLIPLLRLYSEFSQSRLPLSRVLSHLSLKASAEKNNNNGASLSFPNRWPSRWFFFQIRLYSVSIFSFYSSNFGVLPMRDAFVASNLLLCCVCMSLSVWMRRLCCTEGTVEGVMYIDEGNVWWRNAIITVWKLWWWRRNWCVKSVALLIVLQILQQVYGE